MGKKNDSRYDIQRLNDQVHQLTVRVDNLVATRDRKYIEHLSDMSKLRKEVMDIVEEIFDAIDIKDEMDSLSKVIANAANDLSEAAEYYEFLNDDKNHLQSLYAEKKKEIYETLEGNK